MDFTISCRSTNVFGLFKRMLPAEVMSRRWSCRTRAGWSPVDELIETREVPVDGRVGSAFLANVDPNSPEFFGVFGGPRATRSAQETVLAEEEGGSLLAGGAARGVTKARVCK